MTIGDLLMLVTLILLFVELLKSTYTSTASLLDHGLSMLVFRGLPHRVHCGAQGGHLGVLFITVATLIDVIAGYTIGIHVRAATFRSAATLDGGMNIPRPIDGLPKYLKRRQDFSFASRCIEIAPERNAANFKCC